MSSWASEHRSEEVRLHAAALQNHSKTIHETVYRKNKLKQATGQSLALMRDLSKAAGVHEEDRASDSSVGVQKAVPFCLQKNFNLHEINSLAYSAKDKNSYKKLSA